MQTKLKYDVELDGKTRTLEARVPTEKTKQFAELEYAKSYAAFHKAGALLESEVDATLGERGFAKKDYIDKLKAIERKIAAEMANLPDEKGNVSKEGTTLADAKAAALRVRAIRAEQLELARQRYGFYANTAERLANENRFAYLIFACTFEGDRLYFGTLDEYRRRSGDKDGQTAAEKFGELYFADTNAKADPEIEFLKRYKFANDKGQLIDEQGRVVDDEGNLVEQEAVAEAPRTFSLVMPEKAVEAPATVVEGTDAAH